MKVAMIGSGNVATVLGKIMLKAGHQIVQVVSRNEHHAKILADTFECAYGRYGTATYEAADLYIFAIADNVLHHLEQDIQLTNRLIVHTAGSVSRNVLNSISEKYGVIYPLQSLSKAAAEIPEVPLLIDGNSTESLAIIQKFAETLSHNVTVADDDERLKYHISAVFVNNFTNHLYAMANEFCSEENIDFTLLFPLIDETTKKIKKYSPKDVQTGPAIRQDLYTLSRHLKLLSADPDLKYIYLKLSESILKLHQPK